MEDYSNIISLDATPPMLTLYEKEDVKTDVKDTSYSVADPTVVFTEGASYTFDYLIENTYKPEVEYKVTSPDMNFQTELNYQKTGKISIEKDKNDYSKTKNIKPTSPTNFTEEEAQFDRLQSKAVKKYRDLKDNVKPIDVLMAQEPDFMSNMYNIYLLEVPAKYRDYPEQAYQQGTTLGTYIGLETDTGRDFLSTPKNDLFSIIGMRTEGIEIPNKNLNTTDIRVAGQTIKKIVGNVNVPNKASFTIDLDQSMFILDAFHRLNGDWWAKEYAAYSIIDVGLLKGNASQSNHITGKQFLLNYGNLPFHAGKGMTGENKSIIDVIVEYDAAYQIASRYNDKAGSHDKEDEYLSSGSQLAEVKDERYLKRTGRVQRYILHDCRFLGRSSSLTFQVNSADPMKATFPFTFRRVLKVTDTGYIY